jgi:hypothetical protein
MTTYLYNGGVLVEIFASIEDAKAYKSEKGLFYAYITDTLKKETVFQTDDELLTQKTYIDSKMTKSLSDHMRSMERYELDDDRVSLFDKVVCGTDVTGE